MYITLAIVSRRIGLIRKGTIYGKCLKIFALPASGSKYLSSYPANETVTLNNSRKSEDSEAGDKVKAV